jgi:hypothetical protein
MSFPPQPDTLLRCVDGEVRAHSLILSLASPLMLELIEIARNHRDPDEMVRASECKSSSASLSHVLSPYMQTTLQLIESTTDISLLVRALSPSLDPLNPRALPTIENVTQLFHLADKYHCPGILAECCDFIQNQALHLFETTPSARLRDYKINTILHFVAIAKKTGQKQMVSACLSSIGRNFFAYQFQSWANFEGSQDLSIRDLDKEDLLEVILSIPRTLAVEHSPILNEEQAPARQPQPRRINVQATAHAQPFHMPLVPQH